MNAKKTLTRQIIERLALLVIPLLGLYLLMKFTYNPHALCTANEHRHTMDPVGYVILAAAIIMIWLLAIIFEQIWRYFKEDRKISFLMLFLMLLVMILIICLI